MLEAGHLNCPLHPRFPGTGSGKLLEERFAFPESSVLHESFGVRCFFEFEKTVLCKSDLKDSGSEEQRWHSNQSDYGLAKPDSVVNV